MVARPMVATTGRRAQVGQSQALGSSGSMTMTENTALAARRALAASVTIKAVEEDRKSREPALSGSDLRIAEAKEGLNQLGMSLFPRPKESWDWAFTRRQPLEAPGMKKSASSVALMKDPEVPRGLSRSESYVACRDGEKPFFGEPRAHGEGVWDGRMRGGDLARSGWAGTFPLSHQRGCMPWAGGAGG
eukprot:TRINITY_DN107972_c0_g1_i1.p1 TRINITY_DN107972_c0_g1~~TRINITY_DN107972_c0_g1_i1.p1  ORF type:complete len:213 (+),score=28.43 TRINITY_DN107972_c0_g1_i1:74-640(+)